jgi:hypothetical protein
METWHQYTSSTFTWGPVIDDGSFLAQPLSAIIKSGQRLDVDAVMTSYNLHEGEDFVPPGFASPASPSKNATTGGGGDGDGFNSSSQSFNHWLRGFLPGFNGADIEAVEAVYPASGEAEEIKWNTTYERAGMVYRDLTLACPALWLATASSGRSSNRSTAANNNKKKKGKGWLIEYTIDPAKHASDTVYVSPSPR